MRCIALALAFLLAADFAAAAQTSKFGIPSTSGAGALTPPVSTTAQLPNCDVSHLGYLRVVTDATTPTYNGALVGGGAVLALVVCKGTGWVTQ